MQDTNEAQAALVACWPAPDGNVTVVGDDDQAIYRFRCAEPRNILALRRALPGPPADRARPQLPLARRDPRRRGALRRAQPAPHREGADRHARARRTGHDARRSRCDRDEAPGSPGVIADALAAGTPPARCSCSPAPGSPPRRCRRRWPRPGIPHRVLGSLGLYERAEVRDALAYLALLANPADAQAFRRAVQAPRRGVGAGDRRRVVAPRATRTTAT